MERRGLETSYLLAKDTGHRVHWEDRANSGVCGELQGLLSAFFKGLKLLEKPQE